MFSKEEILLDAQIVHWKRHDDNSMGLSLPFSSGAYVITQLLMESCLYWTALILQKNILASGAEHYRFVSVQCRV